MSKRQAEAFNNISNKVQRTQKKVSEAMEEIENIRQKIEEILDKKDEILEDAQKTLGSINKNQKELFNKATKNIRDKVQWINDQCQKYLNKVEEIKDGVLFFMDDQKVKLKNWALKSVEEVSKSIGKGITSDIAAKCKTKGLPDIAAEAIGSVAGSAASKAITKLGEGVLDKAVGELDKAKQLAEQAIDAVESVIRSGVDLTTDEMNKIVDQVISEVMEVQQLADQAVDVANQFADKSFNAVESATSELENIDNKISEAQDLVENIGNF